MYYRKQVGRRQGTEHPTRKKWRRGVGVWGHFKQKEQPLQMPQDAECVVSEEQFSSRVSEGVRLPLVDRVVTGLVLETGE